MKDINELTEKIIGCAIEVHRELGPGLFEQNYELALCIELESAGLRYKRQEPIVLDYKGRPIGEYRIDMLVEEKIVVEIKAVERMDPVFDAQILTYMRASDCRLGLLINFNSRLVKDGIKRFIL